MKGSGDKNRTRERSSNLTAQGEDAKSNERTPLGKDNDANDRNNSNTIESELKQQISKAKLSNKKYRNNDILGDQK